MNKILKKALIILIIMITPLVMPQKAAYAADAEVLGKKASASPFKADVITDYITKYGNTFLPVTCKDFFAAGYKYGDVVTVKFLGKKHKMPFVSAYTDVDSGKPALLARDEDTYIMLAINKGDFATSYGLGVKTTHEDGSIEWNYPKGVTGPVKVSVKLKKAGGYLLEYELHRISYTNKRSDYPNLSDAEFANFREVATTGMGRGRLYRTSTPIDPDIGRNVYADKALKDAGVSVIINLTNTEAEIRGYESFSESCYSSSNFIALPISMDFQSESVKESLARGFKFMADNPGVYAIHCKEGKDRTGFVAAILECLMGAGYEEVVDDYMVTFYNYYGVTKGEPRYYTIVKSDIDKLLKETFTFSEKDKKKDLKKRDLSACAEKYLKEIGLTGEDINRLKENLSSGTGAAQSLPLIDTKPSQD